MNILGRSASKTENNLSYFQSQDIAKLGWVQHAFLTRRGGVSKKPKSLRYGWNFTKAIAKTWLR